MMFSTMMNVISKCCCSGNKTVSLSFCVCAWLSSIVLETRNYYTKRYYDCQLVAMTTMMKLRINLGGREKSVERCMLARTKTMGGYYDVNKDTLILFLSPCGIAFVFRFAGTRTSPASLREILSLLTTKIKICSV